MSDIRAGNDIRLSPFIHSALCSGWNNTVRRLKKKERKKERKEKQEKKKERKKK